MSITGSTSCVSIVLMLTDVTKNAAYGVEIESLVLEINTPTS
ncbi:hypothetical protein ECEPECA14_1063 [Escherichia coli EPECa14]|uniref:Uncharacterized protein n=1 Tax=Escherichia coli O145:H28 (strain RM12581) TaxID=1248823 RepID=A0ABC8A2M6_ECOLR|nr:hypothetical protein ECRM13514_5783 [Escherichia coli O145:H28 str. RM13514]AHY74285.1 hypothetical protein ECRM12581_29405 [Escherichia coli O145:H28 str. RM12581]EFZ43194.1 hypothetical protein ECEPECA14_1063 [Escherichia coli EPECa14]EHW18426.1 hypothetical protein ECDEC8C_2508 [Escherichia coli DEC8C]EHW26901.1 hypothetical protein ECDEC8D_2163 [Escherichia coli DEC8D]EKJ29490.1 hypothetical protein ECEC1865_6368 [Escherichia coli EC1865]